MKKLLPILAATFALSTSALANDCQVFGNDFIPVGPFTLKSGYAHTLCIEITFGSEPRQTLVRKSPTGETSLYKLIDETDYKAKPTQKKLTAVPNDTTDRVTIGITLLKAEEVSETQVKMTAEFRTQDGTEEVTAIVSEK